MSHSHQQPGRGRGKSTAAGTAHIGNDGQLTVSQLAQELEQTRAARNQAQEDLRQLQALYSSLVDQMPAGVFRKDAEGRFVFVNSWFCRLKKMRPEEMLNKTPEQLAQYEIAAQHGGVESEVCREAQLAAQGANHHQMIMRTDD